MKLSWLLVAAAFLLSRQSGECSIREKEEETDGKIQGEVVVISAPLSIKGPPKGFPLIRQKRETEGPIEGRKKGKGGGGMTKKLKKIWPYLLVPAMMSLGYAPFLLSSLKMFVMKALMLNMMALNAAIFLTLRNLVFGPRVGQNIKYYNFGYKQNKQHHHHHHHGRSLR